MKVVVHDHKLSGSVITPPSKSDGQRAILAATLASGSSVLKNIGDSKDEKAMLWSCEQLGAKVVPTREGIIIDGLTKMPQNAVLNCGESGLGLRLMTGICAVLDGNFSVKGVGSILNRKNEFFTRYFPQWGVSFNSNASKLPFEISGVIKENVLEVDGKEGSQFISGLLFALPLLDRRCTLEVKNMVSTPYIEMTLDTLKQFGVQIERKGNVFTIPKGQQYQPADYSVEGDWSSAGYWLVASAIGHDITVQGLNIHSKQADKAILDVFERANCTINHSTEGISIHSEGPVGFEFDATNCPDLFPALVVLAANCEGASTIRGVHRLYNKESNRANTLKTEFTKLGVGIDIEDDIMRITPGLIPQSYDVDANNDHRIAMSLAILATTIEEDILIEGAEAVDKSYPDFWEVLKSLM